MSSYAPGEIGSLLKVKSKVADDLFAPSVAEKLKAKARPITAVETKKEPSPKESKKQKRAQREAPEHSDSEDEESVFEEDTSASEDEQSKEEEEESVPEEKQDERAPRTIFVGNIPVNLKSDDETEVNAKTLLKKLEKDLLYKFKAFGKVESIRLRSLGLKSIKVPSGSDYKVVRKVAAVKGSLDERVTKCNAYIVYEDESSVQQAVERANGTEFRGNHLRVDAIHEGKNGQVFDRNRTVFVGNLTFEATEEDLRKHFTGILGEDLILSVRIISDPRTNLGRGFGYVLLKERDIVEIALKKVHETKLQGRALRVTRCERSKDKKLKKQQMKRAEEAKGENIKDWQGKRADPAAKVSTRRKNIVKAQKLAYKSDGKKAEDKTKKPAAATGDKKEKKAFKPRSERQSDTGGGKRARKDRQQEDSS